MKITPKFLQKELTNLLYEVDIPFKSVQVRRNPDIDMIIGVNWSEGREILLQYHDTIKDFSMKEIRAVLKHEACHYLSLPISKMTSYKDMESYNVKYALVFREYLAHKEFKNRFGFDENLKSYHVKLFKTYDTLVEGSRKIIKAGKWDMFSTVLDSVFGMLYSSMFFYVFEDDAFKAWCEENDLSNLHVLFSWIYEDMKYFDEMVIRPEDREQLIQKVAALPVSMDYSRLLMNNALTLHGRVLNKSYEFGEFAEIWKNRVLKEGGEII